MADIWPILARYPQVPCNPRVTPVRGGGFSGAGVWRIDAEPGPVCVRQWPANSLPVARLHELHRFLAFLSSRGVSEVAVPFRSHEGTTLVEHAGRLWQLEPWMPGTADFRGNFHDERLVNAMTALARLHRAAADYVASETGTSWFFQSAAQTAPALRERLQILRQWDVNRVRIAFAAASRLWGPWIPPGTDEALRAYVRVAPTIAAELSAILDRPFRLHPCLRDVWHKHVLFQGNEVAGIIDPGAARSENVASDLSRLLGSMLMDDTPRWEFALAAYSRIRPLSAEERRLITVLDRSAVLLSSLHWLDTLSRGSLPGDADEVHSRVDVVVNRLQSLVSSIERL